MYYILNCGFITVFLCNLPYFEGFSVTRLHSYAFRTKFPLIQKNIIGPRCFCFRLLLKLLNVDEYRKLSSGHNVSPQTLFPHYCTMCLNKCTQLLKYLYSSIHVYRHHSNRLFWMLHSVRTGPLLNVLYWEVRYS